MKKCTVVRRKEKDITKAFEMWLCRRMKRIKWIHRMNNEEVLKQNKGK